MHIFIMKKYIFLLLNVLVITLRLHATTIPFEHVGEFEGRFRDPYQQNFPLKDALIMGISGTFETARFYLSVGDKDEGIAHSEFPNTGRLRNFVNFRELSDNPLDYVAFLLQRHFPSQDGINLIPNQLSMDDPVRAFTPKTVGIILNLIRDYYENPPEDRGQFSRQIAFAIDHDLNPKSVPLRYTGSPRQIEDAYVKREKVKKHKYIADYAQALIMALDDAQQKSIYSPYFVHKALMSFALYKAGRAVNPKEAMIEFYAAMPDVVDAGRIPGEPFTREMYESLKARIIALFSFETPQNEREAAQAQYGLEYRLPLREEICFLYGKQHFESLFPKAHYLNTARYNDVQFSTCGEVAVLNWLNLLLYDFKEKRLRVEMLELMEGVYEPLRDYYKHYPTEIAQQSKNGQDAWVKVVSGHDCKIDRDLYYHKGDGTCELLHGVTSMAGLMRALFPDQEHVQIRDNQTMTHLERAAATIQHMAEKFSNDQETWNWAVEGAPYGQEHVFTRNNLTLNFSKSGRNIPMDGILPIEGDIFTLTITHNHYDASFLGGTDEDYMQAYYVNAVRGLIGKKDPLSEVDCAFASKSIFTHFLINVFYKNEDLDENGTAFESLFASLNPEYQERLRYAAILNLPEQTALFRSLLFTYLIASNSKLFYPMAANLLESLPHDDPTTVALFLISFLDKDGNLKDLKVHPRIDALYAYMCDKARDPKFAYDCLSLDTRHPGLNHFLMQYIKEMTKEQALAIIGSWAECNEITHENWEELIDRYGHVFKDAVTGDFDAKQFLLYQPNPTESSVLEGVLCNAKQDVIKLFVDKGWITKEGFLSFLKEQQGIDEENRALNGLTDGLAIESRSCFWKHISGVQLFLPLRNFMGAVTGLNITKEALFEIRPNLLIDIFSIYTSYSYFGSEKEYPDGTYDIIHGLKLTKEDLTKEIKSSEGSSQIALASLLSSLNFIEGSESYFLSILKTLHQEFRFTREDFLANIIMRTSLERLRLNTREWLISQDIITKEDVVTQN